MRNLRRVAAAAVALSLVAAACGSDDDDGATEGTDASGTTGETTAGSDDMDDMEGGAELRWRTRPDNDAEAQVYADVSAAIDAEQPFALAYEPGGTETSSYQDQLVTEIGNGTAPDVFWIPGTDIARFQKEGLILDLGPLAADEGFDTGAFYPEPMFHLTYDPAAGAPSDAVLWGLPRDVSTFALYLNLDLIAQAGAEDPRVLAEEGNWNWDTFTEVITAVTETGGANKGFAMNGWWANYGAFMNAAGGGFFTEDRTAVRSTPTSRSPASRRRRRSTTPGWQCPTARMVRPHGRPAPSVRSSTDGGPRRAPAPTPRSTGTSSNCPRVRAARRATGCSGVPMWSTPTPSIPPSRGSSSRR